MSISLAISSEVLVDDHVVSDFLCPAGYHYYDPDTLELDGESNINFAWVTTEVTDTSRAYIQDCIDEIRVWAREGNVVWCTQETFPPQINDKLEEKLASQQPVPIMAEEDAQALQTVYPQQTQGSSAPEDPQQEAAATSHTPI